MVNANMYFSDREHGPRPRTQEEIPIEAWGGIVTVISSLAYNGAFGIDFPEECPDGGWTVGYDQSSLMLLLSAEIPDIKWPLEVATVPPTMVALDCLQFLHRHVAQPERLSYHTFYRHHHLAFDREQGQHALRDDINRILARNGVAYELQESGEIQRLAPRVLADALASATFNTGDAELNSMLESARVKYLSPSLDTRKEALEKLWDAWERVKSTGLGKDKKASVAWLLDKAAHEPKFRQVLEDEAVALTSIGNAFQIRHSETSQVPLQTSAQLDYLFHRLFAMTRLILG